MAAERLLPRTPRTRSPEVPLATATKTRWQMSGQGYEFCNCDFGCGCNFGGFPNSKDGSCRALVGFTVTKWALRRHRPRRREGRRDLRVAEGDSRGPRQGRLHRRPRHHRQAGGGALPDLHRPARWNAVGAARTHLRGRRASEAEDHHRGQRAQEHVPHRGCGRSPRRYLEEPGHGRGPSRQRRPARRVHLEEGRGRPGLVPRVGRRSLCRFNKTNFIYYHYDWSNAA